MYESNSVVARHGRARLALLAAGLLAGTGCIPLAVGPNNFRPAGEIRRYAGSFAVSAQTGPIMNMPGGDPSESVPLMEGTLGWPIVEMSASFAPVDNLLLELQVNAPFSILPFVPVPIGLGGGGRTTLAKQGDSVPISVDALVHGDIAGGTLTFDLSGTRTKGTATLAGGRVGLVVTRKVASFFSASLAPYFRGFRFDTSLQPADGSGPVNTKGGWLLAGGASLSVELKAGPLVLVPAFAVELDANPHGIGYFVITSPGLQLGLRW